MQGIIDAILEFFDSIKEFFVENSNNPFLWVGIFIVGLLIYLMVYNALSKEN